MTNGTKLITGNHLETASVNAKRYILAELLALTNTITAELNLKADDEIFSAGASGIVPAPTANDANNFLRGDGQWATPTVIIGTTSSTVDGGLWFEVVDGLPVVKMNHGGDEFILDTRPAGDVLIGNKLYLGGHIFKFTGFASGLTFSENNFYVADTVVGTVADYQFVFTDAATLSVAEGGTIAITQLDTDVVDFSLNLGFLNVNPLPAPNIAAWYWGSDDFDLPTHGHTFVVTDAATSLTAGWNWFTFGIVTDSTGNLNITGTPAKGAAIVTKQTTEHDFKEAVSSNARDSTLPANITAIQNPNYWTVFCSFPSLTDPDCLGTFTLVLNATETHSSVTISLNVTEIDFG